MPTKLSLLLCSVTLGILTAVGCSSSSSDDDKGSGGDGGSSSSGGKGGGGASGGKGGSAGKGGAGSGGAAGANAGNGGSTGGSSGGGSGGAGGSANGGSGGSGGSAMMTGGTAGSSGGAGAGATPPALTGPGVLFSGVDMTLSKLVPGDAMPGFFYASENVPAGVVFEAVNDPALPAGTKFAATATLDPTKEGNFIFGFNFRQNKPDMKWNYFDASAYAGLSFWVRGETTGAAVVMSYYQYDETNFTPASQYGGTCAADPCTTAIAEYASVVARKTGWSRIVQRFSYNTAGTPKLSALGRIDMLQLRLGAGGPASKMMITGVHLLKESELPAAN